MLTRFINWIKSKSSFHKQDDFWFPQERFIYRYYDGREITTADPLVLHRKMADVGPELYVELKVSQSPMKDAGKAHNDAVAKIRGIFSLRPLEEGGLTELECVELLNHYLAFCEDIKKNSRSLATSATVTSPASVSSSTAVPPTASSSVSGSTKEGHPSVVQESLPTG